MKKSPIALHDPRFFILFFALLAVLISGVAGYGYYVTNRDLAFKAAHDEATFHLEIVRVHVLADLERHAKAVRALASFHGLQDVLQDRSPATVERVNGFLRYLKQTLEADVCYVLDRNGTAIAASNSGEAESFIGKNYAFRPYFQEAITGRDTIYPGLGVTSGKRGIYFAHPLYLPAAAEPAGVIVVKDSTTALDSELEPAKEGDLLLVDPRGLIFAGSRPAWLLRFLWQPTPAVLEELRASRQYGDGPWAWSGLRPLDAQRVIAPDRTRYWLHSKDIPGFPGWRLLFLHDLAALQARVYNPLFKTALTAVLGLCLVVAVVSLLLYRKASANILLQRAAEAQLARHHAFLASVIESLPYPFYVVDAEDYTVTLGNALALQGHAPNSVTCHELTHHCDVRCDSEAHLCPLAEVKRTRKPVVTQHVHHDAAGASRFIEVHGYPIFDAEGKVVQMIEAAVDVTEQRTLENKLQEMSITDELTGRLNRRGFLLMAEQQLKAARRGENKLYLLYADLDNMKWINDTLGHEEGDAALRETATLLAATFRESDIIARLGGDEFVALLAAGPENADRERITERFSEGLAALNAGKQRRFTLKVSVGVAEYDPDQPIALEKLIAQADAMMYVVKEQARRDKQASPDRK